MITDDERAHLAIEGLSALVRLQAAEIEHQVKYLGQAQYDPYTQEAKALLQWMGNIGAYTGGQR